MTKRIALRLDASSAIGTGHLMRCLAIADHLTAAGWECHFLCHQLDDGLRDRLQGYSLHWLDAPDSITPLQQLQPDWLLVDHYQLDAQFEAKARPYCGKILVLDDLADRSHDADLLLDQGPLRCEADYVALLPQGAKQLLGCDYALLRSEFRQLARQHCAELRRGLICFGGSDPSGATLATLNGLLHWPQATKYQWTVVAGAANPFWDKIVAFVTQHPELGIRLLHQTEQMPQLLAEQDFTIGAAGGMTWERACLGIPTLAVPIVANQFPNIAVIERYRFAELLSLEALSQSEELGAALERLFNSADEYRQRGQALVDGLGLERLLKALENQ